MKIQNLEKRVCALEPEPPGESEDYDALLSQCTRQELKALHEIAKRLEKLPENEQTLTSSEREIVEAIERRLGIGQETEG